MKKIRVTNYFDVWGNKKDGWEVNNLCHDDYSVRSNFDIWNKKAVLRFLKRIDFLNKTVRMASLDWEATNRGFIIDQHSDGCPVCSVEEVME